MRYHRKLNVYRCPENDNKVKERQRSKELTASTMMIPKIPIRDAREFQTSAFSVNPQNETGNFGSSLGESTCTFATFKLTAWLTERNTLGLSSILTVKVLPDSLLR